MNHMKYVIGFAAFSAAIFPCAFAQDTIEQTAAVTSEDGIETFRSDWFAAYNPVTAFDMVSRIPGFEIDDGDEPFQAFAWSKIMYNSGPQRLQPLLMESMIVSSGHK